MDQVYTATTLSHPLDPSERIIIDDVWEFIKCFQHNFIFVSDYRDDVITKVQNRYTPQQFLQYESIANKLYWNLRDHLQPPTDTIIEPIAYTDLDDAIKESKVLNHTYYRSFINKIVIADETNSLLYTKRMEGSSDIFANNDFNLCTLTILFDRSTYEQVMLDSLDANTIELPEHYLEYDYAFPNINTMVYTIGSKKQRLDRIRKMYFVDECANWWFRILR